jgi:DNA-directed RNA polymerase subunit RPC12/RpoP
MTRIKKGKGLFPENLKKKKYKCERCGTEIKFAGPIEDVGNEWEGTFLTGTTCSHCSNTYWLLSGEYEYLDETPTFDDSTGTRQLKRRRYLYPTQLISMPDNPPGANASALEHLSKHFPV